MFHIPARGIAPHMPGQAPAPPGASLGQDFVDAARQMGLTAVRVSASQGVLKVADAEHTILFDSLRRVWEQSPLEGRPAVVESFLRAALSKVDAPDRTGFAEA